MCGDSCACDGLHFEEAVPAGAARCGGEEMAMSIAASINALATGVESTAVLERNVGELVVRPWDRLSAENCQDGTIGRGSFCDTNCPKSGASWKLVPQTDPKLR
ncbi:unnamed protein product [Ectocarpus sp. 8 AP-2014]